MSDIPRTPEGGEEFDLGEIEEGEDDAPGLEEGSDGGDDGDAEGSEGEGGEQEEVGDEPPRRRPGRSERLREKNAQLERQLAEAQGFQRAFEQFRSQPQQPQVDPALL